MDWTVLGSLDSSDVRSVLALATRRHVRGGDTLFHQGDPADTIHLLERGHVAIRLLHPNGTTITLDVLAPGSVFGEQCLVDDRARRTASAVAIGTVETRQLRRDDFVALQQRRPAVTDVLVRVLAAQVRRLSGQLLDAHTTPADQRVVAQLRRLAATFAIEGTATLPITQEDLAALAGTTRSTANRALQPLVDAGAIALRRGRIEVLDPRMLEP